MSDLNKKHPIAQEKHANDSFSDQVVITINKSKFKRLFWVCAFILLFILFISAYFGVLPGQSGGFSLISIDSCEDSSNADLADPAAIEGETNSAESDTNTGTLGDEEVIQEEIVTDDTAGDSQTIPVANASLGSQTNSNTITGDLGIIIDKVYTEKRDTGTTQFGVITGVDFTIVSKEEKFNPTVVFIAGGKRQQLYGTKKLTYQDVFNNTDTFSDKLAIRTAVDLSDSIYVKLELRGASGNILKTVTKNVDFN